MFHLRKKWTFYYSFDQIPIFICSLLYISNTNADELLAPTHGAFLVFPYC